MWLGALLILGGIMFDIMGVTSGTVLADEGEYDFFMGMTIVALCTATMLVPGIILFAMGRKIRREEEETTKIASYLQSFRRIKTSDVAKKLGKTEYEAEQLIIKCIQKGLIVGYFDRATGEFFTYQSMFQEVGRPDKCPNCGASMYTRVLTGEDAVCNYCGTHFTPRPPPGAPQQPYYPQQQYQQQQRPAPPQYGQPYPPYPQTAPARPPPPPRPPQTAAAARTNVRCPSCNKVFEVSAQTRPFRISCPFCNIEGIMK
jgi:hypothetical protein